MFGRHRCASGLDRIRELCPSTKNIITKSNLSTLKGKWEGWTVFSTFQANPVLTTMEIDNDTVPIKGRINLFNLPKSS